MNTAATGHTAASVHTRGLRNERQHRVTRGISVHGVSFHIAVVVHGDGGQQGGAHGVEEGAAGGQHAQGVAEAGEVEEEPVVAHGT